MGRLTLNGAVELVSRDQILSRERGQGIFIFPVQLTTSRIGSLTRLIHTLLYIYNIYIYIMCVCDDHNIIHIIEDIYVWPSHLISRVWINRVLLVVS